MNTDAIKFHKSFHHAQNLIDTIKEISLTCNQFDNLCNPFFVDDVYKDSSVFPWLYYATDNSKIIGFISIYIIDTYNVEICGFVLPKYRRNKIGTNLFSMMVMDFHSKSFQLSMDVENEIGKTFVSQMGFVYASTECNMQLDKNNYTEFKETLSLTPQKQDGEIIITGIINDKEIGQSIISVFDTTVCIHDVEIYEQYREKGYGYRLIGTLLNHIFEKYNLAILHVTKENTPAYRLYKKIGFVTVQELEYYEI